MCEQNFNDINEILKTFEYFIDNYEKQLKLKTSVDEIKDHFKAANFIEKTIEKMEEKLLLDKFIVILNTYFKNLNRTLTYDTDFYKYACDKTLEKFIEGRKFDIEIALRMYTSFCNEERFENVLEKIILNSGINEAIHNYIVSNKNQINLKEIQCRIMLDNFVKEINNGKIEEIKKYVESTLESYKVNEYLPNFIGILTLENCTQAENTVKNILLKELLTRMDSRSYFSKEFWITLLKNTDKDLIVTACKKYKLLLESLLNILVYCGTMMSCTMNNSVREWHGDTKKSICPEVGYEDILIFLKSLTNLDEDISKYTRDRIKKAKTDTNVLIWDDIVSVVL